MFASFALTVDNQRPTIEVLDGLLSNFPLTARDGRVEIRVRARVRAAGARISSIVWRVGSAAVELDRPAAAGGPWTGSITSTTAEGATIGQVVAVDDQGHRSVGRAAGYVSATTLTLSVVSIRKILN